jgi:hypothetical protein
MNNAQCANCDQPSTPQTPYCKNCGANICFWKRQSVAKIIKRRDKLRLFHARMAAVIEIRSATAKSLRK